MKFEVIAASRLSAEHIRGWKTLRAANPELVSPYFHPEFTAAAGRAYGDVEVGIVEDGGAPIAFFPFHRRRFGVARPIGDRLSDYHGLISTSGTRLDARRLLRACHLKVFPFDHALASQATFLPFSQLETESPIVQFENGFDSYVDARKKAGSNRVSQVQRKARKLAREVGPIRLELHVDDARVLDQIIGWKSEQCRRANIHDYFSDASAVRLVRDVSRTKVDGFEGMVSVLYVGEHVAAAHMGMRSGNVLHWWFPGYDHTLAKYSPGGILFLKLVEALASRGVTTLDLGKGESAYKNAFMTGSVPLIEGVVDVPSVPALVRRARLGALRWRRSSKILAPLRNAWRARKGWQAP
jgi:CelD/BcsL family acetyltransferase involved in cellulose biosynthesis